MRISTDVLIDASLSKVWGALVDFPRYRSWHPFVEIEGPAKEGAEVDYFYRNTVDAPRGMSMKAVITKLQPTREICIEFGIRGIASISEHYVLAREGTQIRVVHKADVTGLLPFLAGPLVRTKLTDKFQLPLDWLVRHLKSKPALKSGRGSWNKK